MIELSDVRVDARGFEIGAQFGGVTAVVGPNGAGKSTLLSLVAGALRPDRGSVLIDGDMVAGPGVFVPAHRRKCAYLEQRPLLFPHLSVLDNAAFGATRERAMGELAAVGMDDLAPRRPRQLSGGQAQRVAIARALAIDPRVVLLDEPLAALDASVVPEIRRVLRERLAGRTALLVTHNLLDVLTLADAVCVLDGGRVVEQGPVSELAARPTSAFLADLVGVNVLAGLWSHGAVDLGGLRLTGVAPEPVPGHASDAADLGGAGSVARDTMPEGATVLASFAPNAVSLHREAPGGSPRNALPVVVESLEPRGGVVRVWASVGTHRLGADVTAASVAELDIVPGATFTAVVKATQVTVYPRPS